MSGDCYELADSIVEPVVPSAREYGPVGDVIQTECIGEFLILGEGPIAVVRDLPIDEQANHSEKGIWSRMPIGIRVFEGVSTDCHVANPCT